MLRKRWGHMEFPAEFWKLYRIHFKSTFPARGKKIRKAAKLRAGSLAVYSILP